jgi:hypothetical protein
MKGILTNTYIMYEKRGKKGKRGNGDFKLFGGGGSIYKINKYIRAYIIIK